MRMCYVQADAAVRAVFDVDVKPRRDRLTDRRLRTSLRVPLELETLAFGVDLRYRALSN